MKTARFEQLRQRIDVLLERHAKVAGEFQTLEGRLAKRDREISEIKKKLETALQEREDLRRMVGAVIEKIEALEI